MDLTIVLSLMKNNSIQLANYLASYNYRIIEPWKITPWQAISCSYRNDELQKDISISYIHLDGFGREINDMSFRIHFKDRPEINSDKFIHSNSGFDSDHFQIANQPNLCLSQKISFLISRIIEVLKHPALFVYWTRNEWTTEYYKPWYEGTDL